MPGGFSAVADRNQSRRAAHFRKDREHIMVTAWRNANLQSSNCNCGGTRAFLLQSSETRLEKRNSGIRKNRIYDLSRSPRVASIKKTRRVIIAISDIKN